MFPRLQTFSGYFYFLAIFMGKLAKYSGIISLLRDACRVYIIADYVQKREGEEKRQQQRQVIRVNS